MEDTGSLDKGRILLIKITLIFIAVVAVLIFFSKTIYEYNLPAVSLGYVKDGFILNTLRSEGIVVTDEEEEIISEYSGKIELFVSEGDTIKAGDVIYAVVLDTDTIEKELNALEQNKSLLQNNILKIKNDIFYQENQVLEEELLPAPDTALLDLQIAQQEQKIQTAKKDLENTKILYENSALSLEEVENKNIIIKDLENQLNETLIKKDKVIKDYELMVSEREKTDNENAKKKTKALEDYQYQLKNYKIDLDYTEEKIHTLEEQLLSQGKVDIVTETGGVVTAIYDHSKTGRYIQKNTPVFLMQPEGAAPMAKFYITDKFDFMKTGDRVVLDVKTYNQGGLEGKLEEIIFKDEGLYAKVSFQSQIQLKGGETVEALFEKKAGRYPYILPNTAVREGQNSAYILYAEKVKSTFGSEFIAKEIPVTIMNQDKNNCYISPGETSIENLPIIINSNKAVLDGTKVKIVGEGTFTAIR